MTKIIDINCDMGESYGSFVVGNDQDVFPYISSCNIACGFHGGDPVHMERTVRRALEYGVRIGAHPSYPDLWGFGRRPMILSPREVKAIIRYQVAALMGVARALGGNVSYVKPHGALYNTAATQTQEARSIAEAVGSMGEGLALMGLAGSMMEKAAQTAGIPFIGEAFADRRYMPDGTLVPRRDEDAVIDDPEEAAVQVVSIVQKGCVIPLGGGKVTVSAQSICVHGDHPGTVHVLKAIERRCEALGIQKKAVNP